MDNTEKIIQAIKNRNKISFNYKDKGTRIAAPCVLYLNPKNEKMFDAFQCEGYSGGGNLPGWRPFSLENTSSIEILDENFEINQDYNPDSARYANAIYKL